MYNDLNDKWPMLSYSSLEPDIDSCSARKMSKITGVNFSRGYISDIVIGSELFSYIYDTKCQLFDISYLKAKSWSELLIALDLANCIFDEPRIP